MILIYLWGRHYSWPVLALLLIAAGIRTHDRNHDYRSELAIWEDTVARVPDSVRALNNLGSTLFRDGRTEEAAIHFRTAIELVPQYADAHHNLGCVLINLQRPAEAVTAIAGDLILGFRAGGGQGALRNLTVNLGPASNYYGAAPGTSFVVTSLSPADLSSIYDNPGQPNSWSTRSDLSWGIAGTTGAAAVGIAPARTLWASRAETTPGTPSTPWLRGTTWSRLNSLVGNFLPQYWHWLLSRAKMFRRLNLIVCFGSFS